MVKKILLINDTSTELHIGSSAVIENFKFLCKKHGMHLTGSLTRKDVNAKNSLFHRHLRNCNGIIINGEGSLHHSPVFLNDLIEFLPRNIPTVLINSLWQQNNNNRVQEFLQNLKLISLRESLSYNDLTTHYKGLQNVQVVPDILFYQHKPFESVPGYGDSVLTGLRLNLKKHPNYFPMQYTNNFPTIEAYMSWLKGLKIHITGRFHGVCLSAMAGVPFLAFPSNSHKIQSILTDMECKGLIINSFDEVEGKTQLAREFALKANIYATKAKDKIDNLFQTIGGLI